MYEISFIIWNTFENLSIPVIFFILLRKILAHPLGGILQRTGSFCWVQAAAAHTMNYRLATGVANSTRQGRDLNSQTSISWEITPEPLDTRVLPIPPSLENHSLGILWECLLDWACLTRRQKTDQFVDPHWGVSEVVMSCSILLRQRCFWFCSQMEFGHLGNTLNIKMRLFCGGGLGTWWPVFSVALDRCLHL